MSIYATNTGDRLTIGAGQTIAGTGNLGRGSTNFTNNGTITANQNGNTLTLQPATGGFTTAGAGTARAENGGVLILSGGTFNGGTFTALTGSTVQITGGATLNGSTLATAGTGTITTGGSTFTNVTNSGVLNVANGSTPTVTGTLTNNGTVNLNSTGNGVSLFLTGPTNLNGTGTINLIGVGVRVYSTNVGDLLTVGANQNIAGTGNLGNGSTTINVMGSISANVNGSMLTIQPSNGAGTFVNQATGNLYAVNGATLALNNFSGATFTNQGSFSVTANSTLSVSAGALTNFSGTTLTGGRYYVVGPSSSAPATLSLGGGSIVTNNALVVLQGPGAVFNEFNALANNASNGTFNVIGGNLFTTAGALTNAGTLQVNNTSKLTVTGALNNSGQATVDFGGNITVQGNATNSGALSARTGTVAIQGTLNSSGTLLVLQNGTITSGGVLTIPTAASVIGSGNLTAPSFALSGTVFPGDTDINQPAVGKLTLNGAVGLTGNTALVFDLAGTAASDRIQVNGALTLDGTLTVNALAGFGAGRYDLIDYTGALTNNTLDLGALPAGYNYAIDTSIAGQVDLVVTSTVPEPGTWALMLMGAGGLLFVTRRMKRHA